MASVSWDSFSFPFCGGRGGEGGNDEHFENSCNVLKPWESADVPTVVPRSAGPLTSAFQLEWLHLANVLYLGLYLSAWYLFPRTFVLYKFSGWKTFSVAIITEGFCLRVCRTAFPGCGPEQLLLFLRVSLSMRECLRFYKFVG